MTNKGQTLLELIVALGLIIIVITALTTSSINSLKNSSFSQNQLTATKLAQEGLDIIRSIRLNGTVCNQPANNAKDFPTLLSINTCGGESSCVFILNTTPSTSACLSPASTTSNWLKFTKASLSSSVFDVQPLVNGVLYKRQVFVIDRPIPNQKEIKVKITWTDSTGAHESEISTILTN